MPAMFNWRINFLNVTRFFLQKPFVKRVDLHLMISALSLLTGVEWFSEKEYFIP